MCSTWWSGQLDALAGRPLYGEDGGRGAVTTEACPLPLLLHLQVVHLHQEVEAVDDLGHGGGADEVAAVGVDSLQLHPTLEVVLPDLQLVLPHRGNRVWTA